MNRAILAALKPGGVYAILDSSARPGSGLQDTKTLHRIDEETVRAEVERVGFKLAGKSDLLRNPSDTRDWNSSPVAAGEKRGTGDRFVDKFVKP
jgi:predicted methyltransferase